MGETKNRQYVTNKRYKQKYNTVNRIKTSNETSNKNHNIRHFKHCVFSVFRTGSLSAIARSIACLFCVQNWSSVCHCQTNNLSFLCLELVCCLPLPQCQSVFSVFRTGPLSAIARPIVLSFLSLELVICQVQRTQFQFLPVIPGLLSAIAILIVLSFLCLELVFCLPLPDLQSVFLCLELVLCQPLPDCQSVFSVFRPGLLSINARSIIHKVFPVFRNGPLSAIARSIVCLSCVQNWSSVCYCQIDSLVFSVLRNSPLSINVLLVFRTGPLSVPG